MLWLFQRVDKCNRVTSPSLNPQEPEIGFKLTFGYSQPAEQEVVDDCHELTPCLVASGGHGVTRPNRQCGLTAPP